MYAVTRTAESAPPNETMLADVSVDNGALVVSVTGEPSSFRFIG